MRLLLSVCLLACAFPANAFEAAVFSIEVSSKEHTKVYVAKSIKIDGNGDYQIEDFCNPGQVQTIRFSRDEDGDERMHLTVYAPAQGQQVCENKHLLER